MKIPEELETRRLILRPYIDRDFNSFSLLLKDQSVLKNLYLVPERQTSKGNESIFSSIIESYNSTEPLFALAICIKDNEVFIGTCGLIFSEINGITECFYALLPEYRRNGFAIESMLRLLEFSFGELKIPKIVVYMHPNNTRAWKVAERIGMKYLGHAKHKNILPKAMLFSIEKEEYDAQHQY
jgi:RimJ/RimL family protein N-acetyltransferase